MYFLDSASNRKYSSYADNSVRGMVKKRRAKKRAGNADEFDAAGGEAPKKKKRKKRQKSTEQPAAIARVADDGSQGSKNSDEPEAKKCGEVVAQAGRKKCNVVNALSDADQRGKSREEGAKTQPKSASASKRNARDDFDDAQSSDARGEAFKKTRNMEPLRHASSMRTATDDAQPAGKSANREVEGILSIVKEINCFLDYIVDVDEETNRAPAVSTRMHDDRKSCAPQWHSGHASESQASGGSWQPRRWSRTSTTSTTCQLELNRLDEEEAEKRRKRLERWKE